MAAPTTYDPSSPNEHAPPLPSARPVFLSPACKLQPPLSRRGTGPGLVVVLPAWSADAQFDPEECLDPQPVQKWAEEGFAVAGLTLHPASWVVDLKVAVGELRTHPTVDVADKMGLVVYDNSAADTILASVDTLPQELVCIMIFTSPPASLASSHPPIFAHIPLPSAASSTAYSDEAIKVATYRSCAADFILPGRPSYDASAAALAHTRSLVFLRQHIGGPSFDIEAIWEEHTYWEFERRSVAQTMATMVAEPYVNHVPTMAGGMGREQLTAFYRDHFIFCNPPDTALEPLSRTIGPDRVVDEFIFTCTHTLTIPWLLPGVPPSHLPLRIPMVAVVNVRGDRLYHEHIWWDQATALRQAGILPTHLAAPGGGLLRLPVAGPECARLLMDKRRDGSNAMLHPGWSSS